MPMLHYRVPSSYYPYDELVGDLVSSIDFMINVNFK